MASNRILRRSICFILFCLLFHSLNFTVEARSQFADQDSTYKNKYLILPAISVSPETSLMPGMSGENGFPGLD